MSTKCTMFSLLLLSENAVFPHAGAQGAGVEANEYFFLRCTNPSETIYAVTVQDILTAISRRMGQGALTLTAEELQLAREEVKEASTIIWTSGKPCHKVQQVNGWPVMLPPM